MNSNNINLDKKTINMICKITGATSFSTVEVIQTLWSGYGKIFRIGLNGSSRKSVVVKHIVFPNVQNHPRGWNSKISHERKVFSYDVEIAWYKNWSHLLDCDSVLPECLAIKREGDNLLLILEDLNESGYSVRLNNINKIQLHATLSWLANFHATFLGKTPEFLWEIGSYWHLNTRKEELEQLTDMPLKNAASAIDKKLNDAKYKTFIHGDAKLANFCYSKNGSCVAAVDFQYVGGGCGIKDIVYFIGSCLDEEECEKQESHLLQIYFQELKKAIIKLELKIDFNALESEWRDLYPVAWTDFYRFLKGWSPGHWKINTYSQRLANKVISNIESFK